MNFKKIFSSVICLTVFCLSSSAFAATETVRDSSGKTIGTIITESNGDIIYRDSSNAETGKAKFDRNSKITKYYDRSGREVGSSKVDGSKVVFRDRSNSHIRDITSSSSEKKVMVLDGKIQFFK